MKRTTLYLYDFPKVAKDADVDEIKKLSESCFRELSRQRRNWIMHQLIKEVWDTLSDPIN